MDDLLNMILDNLTNACFNTDQNKVSRTYDLETDSKLHKYLLANAVENRYKDLGYRIKSYSFGTNVTFEIEWDR